MRDHSYYKSKVFSHFEVSYVCFDLALTSAVFLILPGEGGGEKIKGYSLKTHSPCRFREHSRSKNEDEDTVFADVPNCPCFRLQFPKTLKYFRKTGQKNSKVIYFQRKRLENGVLRKIK